MEIKHQFIHSLYAKNKETHQDAVLIKTAYLDEQGNRQPHLEILRNPKRPFWVTKPQFRNHEFKKDYCDKSELDEYRVNERDLFHEAHKALTGYPPRGFGNNPRKLLDSPYIYGADIRLETLLKRDYIQKFEGENFIPLTTGFLDIETSVLPGSYGNINLITVTHETKVYVGINDNYLYKTVETKEHGIVKVKATIDEVTDVVNKALFKHIEKHKFEITYYIAKDEIDLITWIFQQIHRNKTDFIGIWNLGFDIPKILENMEMLNIDPTNILCHPDVPNEFKIVRYKPDNKKTDHFTDKWNWFYLSGYTQFIDSLGLYSRIRKAKGYLSSYKLTDILNKEIGETKLSLGEEGTHYIMQTKRFLEYIAYNIFDAMSLQIMEWKTTDLTTMMILAGITSLDDYSKQKAIVTNELFDYYVTKNKIVGSVGMDMSNEFTDSILKIGGTVLPPEKSKGVGTNAIKERPDFETMLHVFVSDVDFSAYYPKTQCASNISSETKQDTAISIENMTYEEVQSYYSNIISTKENSVHICNRYYGLPNYLEMEELLKDIVN
jgi:hypothetical protein